MDYMKNMDKKKIRKPDTQKGASMSGSGMAAGGGVSTQPVQPVASVQSVTPRAQTTSASGSTVTYRPGVSERTRQALSGYEGGYTPSDAVKAAEQYLQQIQGQKPGEYQSPYLQQLDDLYTQISGRKPFTYDLNADMLYQQYRDQYQRMGQQAMMDTMGQAASLTGGYGSSYSQNAGQQAYQGYLQQLNDKVPDLYRLALDKYNAEGDDLLQQYGLLSDRENQAYGRYRDQVGDWRDELNRAYQRWGDERNWDYGQWSDMLQYWQNMADRENSDYWTQTQFDYQRQRDAVADSQWEREFNAQQAARAASAAAASKQYNDLLAQLQELQTLYKWKNYDASKDHETPGGLGFENVNFSKPVRIHDTPLNSVQEIQDYLDKNAGSWSAAEFARVQRYLQENGINIFKVNGVGSGKGTAWTSQTAHQR